MFDSDEDDFQAGDKSISLQRLLCKKQKATITATSSKRKSYSGAPHSAVRLSAAGKRRKSHGVISIAGSTPITHKQTAAICCLPAGQHTCNIAEVQQPPRQCNQQAHHVVAAADGRGHAAHATASFRALNAPIVLGDLSQDQQAASSVPQAKKTDSTGSAACHNEGKPNPRAQRVKGSDAAPVGHVQQQLHGMYDMAQATQQSVSEACPSCVICLGNFAGTEAGMAAHINNCLDAAGQQLAAVQAAAAAHETQQQVVVVSDSEDEDDIEGWLSNIGALGVLDLFKAADVDLSVLPHLNDGDLQEMGIEDVSMRQTILTAVVRSYAVDGQAARSAHSSNPKEQQARHLEDLSQTDVGDPQGWDDDADCVHDGWGGTIHDENVMPVQEQGRSLQGHADIATAAVGVMPAEIRTPGDAQECQPHSQQAHCQPVQAPLQPAQQTRAKDLLQQQWHLSKDFQQQSSITDWLKQHQHQQPQSDTGQQGVVPGRHHHASSLSTNSKQQWQALFAKPGRVLAPPQPLLQQLGTSQQRQLGQQGQLLSASSGQRLQASAPLQPVGQAVQTGECLVMTRGRTVDLPRWWPAWRRLPGTNIVVDCFGQSSKAIGSNRSWILTHFHADHYTGLTKGFKQGRIVCTRITAALVKLKLRVPEQLLVPLDLGQEILVEGTRLQLIDANHCPGAAMVVAHPPGGLPPVLHTGDARLTVAATQEQPALQALVGKAVLVLDTTYADPAYCFPPQQEVLDWVLRAVKAESFNPRTLFLFGSYTIGKERLFLHVASALKAKVYVAAAKRAVMGAINLPAEQAALLTSNHLEANIHVVPMRQVNLSEMESLLVRYKGRYTAVVGFQPTGWAQAGGGAGASGQPSRCTSSIRPNKRLQRGTVVMYKVPYSEHSSCAELREFVHWFKPVHIVPSVSNDNGQKLKQMLAAVTSSGKVTGPLDGWARRTQQQKQPQ